MATRRAVKGLVLQLSIASVFTTVALSKNIDYPDDENQFVDGTTTDSTDVEDGVSNGLATPGTCKVEILYDPLDTVHQDLITARSDKAVRSWKIKNSNIGATTNHSCSFSGTVKTFKPKGAAGGLMEATLEIKLSAPAEYSEAA